MIVSLNWLKEIVDIGGIEGKIPDALTNAGFEVEEVRKIKVDFSGVITAKIKSIRPHPSADRLTLCEVDTGKEILSIVCGAKNIKEGDICPLALPGAVLPGGIRIEKRKIRGETSYGMLCSEKELGVGEDEKGIMILTEGTEVGVDLKKIFKEDIVMDISVTPNRGDCLSHLGIAREISAIFKREIIEPEVLEEIPSVDGDIIEIEESEGCPFYMGAVIDGLKISASPLWLFAKLKSVGVRCINNIVDITNYVLFEMGQPLHAFDFEKIKGGKIKVRMGRKGEKIITIDHRERAVDEEILLICDGEKPQAIAGIMGGLESEVNYDTKKIFLESAFFSPVFIRKGGKKLGISSEASYRFERGVDPLGVEKGLRRVIFLIKKLFPDCSINGIFRKGEPPLKKISVFYPFSFSERFLGIDVKKEEVKDVMKNLGFEFKEKEDGLEILPPSWRHDVILKEDIAEEIARIKGYEKIPSIPPDFTPIILKKDKGEKIKILKSYLNSLGFNEGIFYSFIGEDFLRKAGFKGEAVKILNPLSQELNLLRPLPLYSILMGLIQNYRQRVLDAMLYEVGKGFYREGKDVREELHLSGGFYGNPVEELWNKEGSGFFFLKGVVEGILSVLRVKEKRIEGMESPLFEEGESARILRENEEIGILGKVHHRILKEMDVDEDLEVFLFDIYLEKILSREEEMPSYKEFSRYPPLLRDLSIVLDEKITWDEIKSAVYEKAGHLLEEISLFDIYRDEKIGMGKKSISFHLIFRSSDSTLKDELVDSLINEILLFLKEKFGAELRR
jgi:phenylalanyl-tRNA synthetase beta chain